MPATLATSPAEAFIDGLKDILDARRVLTAPEDVVFFSTDIAKRGETAEVVIQPKTIDELSRAVAYATGHGRCVIPRGAGFSYTGGYIPARAGSVVVDMRNFDRIVEINTTDMYVTVECGMSWRQLYEALKEKGFRTPYFGPMSGYHATVGGALSQGSFFLGSTQYGTTAESTLGLEVVLADGSVLRTGSAANADHPSPFFRTYGPDLSGIFLGDTGALAFKVRATLKLIPFPEHQAFGTFPFETMEQSVKMVSEVGRLGLAAECYCWDPSFVKSVGERTTMLQDVRFLAGVVGSGNSFAQGLKDAARIAVAGKRVFDGSTYLVHVSIDDFSAEGAANKLKAVRAIAAKHGGGEIEASAPRATRGTPFTNFNVAPFADGTTRNLPTNSLWPHSAVLTVAAEVQSFFDARKSLMEEYQITFGVIYFAVGNNAVCIEPLIYWKDEEHRLHNRLKDKSDVKALAKFTERPAATQIVMQLRSELVDLFRQRGAVHVQIGKSYPYKETREPRTYALLEAIKRELDPRGLVNPGSLGLGS